MRCSSIFDILRRLGINSIIMIYYRGLSLPSIFALLELKKWWAKGLWHFIVISEKSRMGFK